MTPAIDGESCCKIEFVSDVPTLVEAVAGEFWFGFARACNRAALEVPVLGRSVGEVIVEVVTVGVVVIPGTPGCVDPLETGALPPDVGEEGEEGAVAGCCCDACMHMP